MRKLRIAALAMALGAVMSVTAVAKPLGRPNLPVLLKAVDSFTFVVDISGSMMMDGPADLQKSSVAKLVLGAINDRMPSLDYSAALFTASGSTNPVQMAEWDRAAYGQAIADLPTDLAIYGRRTNLAKDIMMSEPGLRGSSVFVTDGVSNIGEDAVAAFAAAKRSTGAKFAIISLANTAEGKANIMKMAAATQAYVVEAQDLMYDPVAVDAFIEEMFYVERAAVVLSSVFFATGKYDLTPETMATLDEAIVTILNNPRGVRTVHVEGFADSVGGWGAGNQTLSENRAKAVRNYFVDRGVSEDIVYFRGDNVSYKNNNATSEGRHDNRRVDIIIN